MSDLTKQNNLTIGEEPRWFTNREIAAGFGCAESAIRSAKERNLADFIEGIDWIYEKNLTSVYGVAGATPPTNDGDSPTLWSEIGVLKLAEKMKLTAKAQLFLLRYHVQQAKKDMALQYQTQIQSMQTRIQELEEANHSIKYDVSTVEGHMYDMQKTVYLVEGRVMRTFKNRVKLEEDVSWMYKDHYLTVPRFFELKDLDIDRVKMRVYAKNFIYWSRWFKVDIKAGRNDSRLALTLAGKGNVFNAEIRFDILNIVWAHIDTSLSRFLKVSEYLYNRKKRGETNATFRCK